MNRLKNLLESKSSKNEDVLNIYFTAGFPSLGDTIPIIKALEESGTDIIELGIPFSDPLADGPTIQKSSELALSNGMTIATLFAQLKNLRQHSDIPIVLMGYLNPILQYGVERFIEDACRVGVDGFIFPDLPTLEFEREWKSVLYDKDLCFSFLVTPDTAPKRVRYLDSLSSGFLYAVSSSSTTGSTSSNNSHKNTESYLRSLKAMKLQNPVLAGFGISNHEDFKRINNLVDGAIIGSAFIRHLSQHGADPNKIGEFVKGIKGV